MNVEIETYQHKLAMALHKNNVDLSTGVIRAFETVPRPLSLVIITPIAMTARGLSQLLDQFF